MSRVVLLSRPWRLVSGLLTAIALVTLPTYLVAVFVLPPIPPVVMVRSFLLGTALPAAVAWALTRAFTGTADVHVCMLHLRRDDLAVEIPCAAIERIRPWWVSLPGPGFDVTLRAGGRAPVGVAIDDPTSLLDALADAGMDVTRARRHPSVVRAASRRRTTWWWLVFKFAAFGTIPATILFYTHQHIAYGGTFGQYYLEGPGAWLTTLAEYWSNTVIMLVSYASCWRGAAETSVWLVAFAGAGPARGARRLADAACALAYWAGVPVLLALRYLA
jgi:apolipoprotein N-acyltransferase